VPAETEAPKKKKSAKAAAASPPAITATVDAKMTFFVCTDQICSRQQKQVSLPVQVCRGAGASC
ncbi:MAG TPA: hypothetical protein VND93_21365, partial [Myxococcales bacterium]|nr:hypothetical protein [Myxococcales bacterium]